MVLGILPSERILAMNNSRLIFFCSLSVLIACSQVKMDSGLEASFAKTLPQPTFEGVKVSRIPERVIKIVDTSHSVIKWRGTKMMHTGEHSGELKLKEGILIIEDGKLVGGNFIANMETILVTDIAGHERTPYTNLTNHLNADFDVKNFPTSDFSILKVNSLERGNLITGEMTIRGVTNQISFEADAQSNNFFHANLVLDRTKWNIGSEGSWLERKLVDDEIELEILIKVK